MEGDKLNEREHLDLFSGIGGFALASRRCGVRTVAFCEIEPYAQVVLQKNFGAVMADGVGVGCVHGEPEIITTEKHVEAFREPVAGDLAPRIYRDIRKLNGGRYAGVWLLTGGFPCQPFSHAGKRGGAADDRHLWPEMLRVISEARPTWVIGENVAGFITMELDRCISDLEALGYAVQPIVIPACATDAKHRRDRVWIIGHAEHNEQPSAKISGSALSRNDSDATRAKQAGESLGSSEQHEILADADGGRLGECEPEIESVREPDLPSELGEKIIADAMRQRSTAGFSESPQRQAGDSGKFVHGGSGWFGEHCRWLAEPELGRVAHGIPRRVDRLRGLGNAIVPQVAEEIISAMIESETLK